MYSNHGNAQCITNYHIRYYYHDEKVLEEQYGVGLSRIRTCSQSLWRYSAKGAHMRNVHCACREPSHLAPHYVRILRVSDASHQAC